MARAASAEDGRLRKDGKKEGTHEGEMEDNRTRLSGKKEQKDENIKF